MLPSATRSVIQTAVPHSNTRLGDNTVAVTVGSHFSVPFVREHCDPTG